MGGPRVVRVAEWDGWCGACATERPLVLTGTGRRRLGGLLADDRVLVLTCRVCGVGAVVPPEEDDPDVGLEDPPPAGSGADVVERPAPR